MSMLKKLHILEFNKYKVIKHYLEIPENIDNIGDLHEYYGKKTKQSCHNMIFYINNGNILKENNKLRDITTDIILVNILQPVRFSNYSSLINNTTTDIRTFLSNVFTNANSIQSNLNNTSLNNSLINNTMVSTSPNTFSVIENAISPDNVTAINSAIQGTSIVTMNNEGEDEAKNNDSNSHDCNENEDETKNNEENSDSNSDDENDIEDDNEDNNENDIEDNIEDDIEDGIEDDIDNDNEDDNEDETVGNNTNVINTTQNSQDNVPDLITVNDELSEVVSIINNLSNSSINNIFNLPIDSGSSGEIHNQTNTPSYQTDNGSEKYKEEFDKMISMGFTDENLVTMSLNLAQGNVENAVNLYLADYQV